MKKTECCDDSGMVFVCPHVLEGMPILYCERDNPIDEIDSGWQFLCYSGIDENEGKICSVNEIIAIEPSLKDFIDKPVGTVVTRKDVNSPWKIESRT